MPRSASASLAWLFDTHTSGRMGSPSVAGSINFRKSSSSVGSFRVSERRPPPARRFFFARFRTHPGPSSRDQLCCALCPSPAPRRSPRHVSRSAPPPPPRTNDVRARQDATASPRNGSESLFRQSYGRDKTSRQCLGIPQPQFDSIISRRRLRCCKCRYLKAAELFPRPVFTGRRI